MKLKRTDLIKFVRFSGLYRNRFYVMGLGLQKGLPIVAIPLLISVFGIDAYGEYVLFYITVQLYANVSSLAVPQALIPLWFRQTEHAQFLRTFVFLLLFLAVAFAVPGFFVLWFTAPDIFSLLHGLSMPLWVMVFAGIYNANSVGMALIRVRENQRRYFWSVVAGALALLLSIWFSSNFGLRNIEHLIIVQLVSVSVATVLLIFSGKEQSPPTAELIPSSQWRPILKLSVPLCVYTIVALYSMSLDKWVMKLWFSTVAFNTYIVDYQFAFATLFIPSAIGLHHGPKVSALIAKRDYASARAIDAKAGLTTIGGMIFMSLGMYCYAWIAGLKPSSGYWILALGFLFEGLYMLISNRLMAEHQTHSLMLVSLFGAILLTSLFAIAVYSNSELMMYLAIPIYFACMLSISYFQLRSNSTRPF